MAVVVPAAGRVVCIDEENYRYGEGPIIFHIRQVGARMINEGAPWVTLVGYKEYPNGQLGPLRTITARLDGLCARERAGKAVS